MILIDQIRYQTARRTLHCFQQGFVPCAPRLVGHTHTHTVTHRHTPSQHTSLNNRGSNGPSLSRRQGLGSQILTQTFCKWFHHFWVHLHMGLKTLPQLLPFYDKMNKLCVWYALCVYIYVHRNIAVCLLLTWYVNSWIVSMWLRVLYSWHSYVQLYTFLLLIGAIVPNLSTEPEPKSIGLTLYYLK